MAKGHIRNAVGVKGFEPLTSWSQTRRASQTAPHPAPNIVSAAQPFEEALEIVLGVEIEDDLALVFGAQTNLDAWFPAPSADARFVAFLSMGFGGGGPGLLPEDTNECPDVYVLDRDFDDDGIYDEGGQTKLIRMSVSTSGQQGVGLCNPMDPSTWLNYGLVQISADGRHVAFNSSANLAAGDVADWDAYVRSSTSFSSWQEMLTAAGTQFFKQKLFG